MAVVAISEPRVERVAGQFRATWLAIRGSIGSRQLWVVAGFILFWVFSPSIGTPLFFHQTDVLKFEQWFIGTLDSIVFASMIVGALSDDADVTALAARAAALCDRRPLYPGFRGYTTYVA